MGGKYVSLGVFLSSCDVSSMPCCAFISPSCNFCTFPVKKSTMSFDNSSLFSLSGKHEVRARFRSWSTQLNKAFWQSSDSTILREKWFFFASLMVFVKSFLDFMNRSLFIVFFSVLHFRSFFLFSFLAISTASVYHSTFGWMVIVLVFSGACLSRRDFAALSYTLTHVAGSDISFSDSPFRSLLLLIYSLNASMLIFHMFL